MIGLIVNTLTASWHILLDASVFILFGLAVASFLIATPESGADSIAITYALLDPIMTVARPLVAFITAFTDGIVENLAGSESAALKSTNPQGVCRQTAVSYASGKQHRSTWKKLVQELH